MKVKLKISKDLMADLFLIFLVSNEAIRIFIGRCLGILGMSSYSGLLTSFIVFLPFILYFCFDHKLNKNIVSACLLVAVVVVFFAISYLIHPSYAEWYARENYGVWDAVFSPVSGGIYTIFVFAMVHDTSRLYKDFRYISFLQFLTCLYQVFIALSRGYWEAYNASGEIVESTYNVDFGYKAAFVAILFLLYFILEKEKKLKIVCLCLSLISTFWVIAYGSRGAIFAYGIGVILFIGFKIRILSKFKQFVVWCVCLLGVIMISSLYDVLLNVLYSLLNAANINSRTVTMILSGSFMDENGRDSISKYAIDLINSQGLLGSGAFGDRPVIGPHYYWGYCHNVVLEFLIDFGVILGVIFFVYLVVKCIRYYLKSSDWQQVGLFITIVSVNMKLFFSDTFWGFRYFWLLIGFLLFMDKGKHPILRRKAGK